MTPAVSIIIPCYNQAHYLPLAIRSVQAQSWPDWEIVLVNDGSTDETETIAAQFTDARIRYIFQNNQGLSAARNTGVRAAQGRYLAFLDSDDEWEPEFLATCIQALESNPTVAGVYTFNSYIDQNSCTLPDIGGEEVAPTAFRSRLLEGGYFPPNSVLVVAEVVREAGLFDVALTSEEDWDLWLRISERHSMQVITQPLARYRSYPGSMSTNAGRMHRNRIAVLTKYFGPPEGNPESWPEEKRIVYAFAHRTSWYTYMQQRQPEDAWQFLEQGVTIWPPLLKRLDTLYELTCGAKINGYRAQVDSVDLQNSAVEIMDRLNRILDKTNLRSMRHVVIGNAYYAIAMRSDQAGNWHAARSYLWKAVWSNPQLIADPALLRRGLKLTIGPRVVGKLRRLQRD